MTEPPSSSAPTLPEELTDGDVTARYGGRFALRGRTVRQHAARGTLINGAFLVGVSGLALVRGFVLAHFLETTDYGVWGILVVALGTLVWLKQVGIGDKYIQQDEPDQELAWQKAFTLEAIFTAAFTVLMALAVPLVALAYGEERLLLPGLVLVLVLPAAILQTPVWILYRSMQFFRQRVLQSIDPVVGTVVAIGMAAAGAGYWALAGGVLAGAWCSAIAAWRSSPYPLRFRYDRGTLRSYVSFSTPLFVASGAGMVIAQSSLFFSADHLGLAGAGAITLAATISQFGDRVDGVVTGTLYPAICSVRDRTELLFETFVKANRLALMWAVPFGVGLALFASDLVAYGIGEKWRAAVPVLQVFGVAAAAGHIGFNWDAYYRARGETRPMAIVGSITAVAFLATAIPLLYTYGLEGFAAGVAVQTAVNLAGRMWYLNRLFRGFSVVRHSIRALAPSLPAIGFVLVLRASELVDRSAGVAIAELALYVGVTIAATVAFERPLLREVAGYLRRPVVAT